MILLMLKNVNKFVLTQVNKIINMIIHFLLMKQPSAYSKVMSRSFNKENDDVLQQFIQLVPAFFLII